MKEKLEGKVIKERIIDGYLINKDYLNYWRKFSDYDDKYLNNWSCLE